MITKAQQRTIDQLRAEIIRSKGSSEPEKHEFKRFEIKDYETFVSLVAEYGRIDDEGTMAAILCRDDRHFIIGKKGGVYLASLMSTGRNSSPKRNAVRGVFRCVNFYHRPEEK